MKKNQVKWFVQNMHGEKDISGEFIFKECMDQFLLLSVVSRQLIHKNEAYKSWFMKQEEIYNYLKSEKNNLLIYHFDFDADKNLEELFYKYMCLSDSVSDIMYAWTRFIIQEENEFKNNERQFGDISTNPKLVKYLSVLEHARLKCDKRIESIPIGERFCFSHYLLFISVFKFVDILKLISSLKFVSNEDVLVETFKIINNDELNSYDKGMQIKSFCKIFNINIEQNEIVKNVFNGSAKSAEIESLPDNDIVFSEFRIAYNLAVYKVFYRKLEGIYSIFSPYIKHELSERFNVKVKKAKVDVSEGLNNKNEFENEIQFVFPFDSFIKQKGQESFLLKIRDILNSNELTCKLLENEFEYDVKFSFNGESNPRDLYRYINSYILFFKDNAVFAEGKKNRTAMDKWIFSICYLDRGRLFDNNCSIEEVINFLVGEGIVDKDFNISKITLNRYLKKILSTYGQKLSAVRGDDIVNEYFNISDPLRPLWYKR